MPSKARFDGVNTAFSGYSKSAEELFGSLSETHSGPNPRVIHRGFPKLHLTTINGVESGQIAR